MPEKTIRQYPYFLFTRTPLHVGAGQSVGYVDLPIQREAHTRIPIVPGTSLKGVLRDHPDLRADADYLFGKGAGEDETGGHAGALLVGEARVLAFPVRSAKGCFAWITCPLMLARYCRDTGQEDLTLSFDKVTEDANGDVTILAGGKITEECKAVLEEYTFGVASPTADSRSEWEGALKALLPDEPVWKLLEGRLAIVPDGIFSFFVQSACEVAQHVSINDETGTARAGALFNQENCPPETLFYGMIAAQRINGRDPKEAFDTLGLLNGKALQIGAGETTGLGWCTFACSFTKADADTEVK